MANLGCIEINPVAFQDRTPRQPRLMVLDLDPLDVPFAEVVKTAVVTTREVLADAGARGFCKTSGATGLHVYVPLGAAYTPRAGRPVREPRQPPRARGACPRPRAWRGIRKRGREKSTWTTCRTDTARPSRRPTASGREQGRPSRRRWRGRRWRTASTLPALP